MALTEVERTKALKHLGYPVLSTPTTLSLGYPAITQANFIAENNLLNLTAAGEREVREQLEKLDCFQRKLEGLADNAEIAATGAIRFQTTDAILNVELLYQRAQKQLADMLACTINPLSIKDRPPGVVEPVF